MGKVFNFLVKLRDKLIINAVKEAIRNENAPLAGELISIKNYQIKTLNDTAASLAQLSEGIAGLTSGIKVLTDDMRLLDKKLFIDSVQRHYKGVKERIADRISNGEKLRFVSYVIIANTFGAHGICDIMLKEPEKYDVKFVICPDIYRDKDFSQYRKTRAFFAERYGTDAVLDGYDESTGKFIDWSGRCDVVYLANPYDFIVDRVHGINFLCTQDVLPIHIEYGMFNVGKSWMNIQAYSTDSCLYYLYFTNTASTTSFFSSHQISPVGNIICSGYPKIDRLAVCKPNPNQQIKKKILISPHQSVKGMKEGSEELQISNFLQYADFIPELAELYPNVDFVFRPHPLLFTQLTTHDLWTKKQVEEYLELLRSKNIMYSDESDYFHLFKECDAIIHDCCSYITEWLYTEKPCCFVMETKEKLYSQLTEDGKIAIEHYFLADSRQKIIEFIDKVIKSNCKIKLSQKFREEIMMKYPKTSEFIFNYMMKDLIAKDAVKTMR